MRKLMTMVAAGALLVTTPAFAGGHSGTKAEANAVAKTKQLNNQQARQTVRSTNNQRQGQVQDQNDSTKVDGSWGFSYVDVPVTVPQATATGDVVVLSDSWKLGPLFGHASQEAAYLPAGVASTYLNVMVARGAAVPTQGGLIMRTDQENYEYEAAFSMQTALCSKDPKTAKQLLLSCVE